MAKYLASFVAGNVMGSEGESGPNGLGNLEAMGWSRKAPSNLADVNDTGGLSAVNTEGM